MSTEKPYIDAGKRLKAVRRALSLDQGEMASKLGIGRSTYQYYERGERAAPMWVLEKMTTFGASAVWLLTGEGDPFGGNCTGDCVNSRETAYSAKNASIKELFDGIIDPSSEWAEKHADVINIEHAEMVKSFIDKKLAKEVNEHLLEIERLNKGAFKEACAYIKGIAAGLKSMVEYDRRQGDRRQGEDENWNPDQERRSGDRRKASGM